MDIKNRWITKWTIFMDKKKWMVGCMVRKNRWMVRKKDNKYENKIDGWIQIYEKNRWMVGWMDRKKAYEQIDGQKNILKIDGWLN